MAGRIGARQANQNQRICQGITSGNLSPGETRQLERQQQHRLQKHKRLSWADGVLTCKEYAGLERE
jgi:hypothetical protein